MSSLLVSDSRMNCPLKNKYYPLEYCVCYTFVNRKKNDHIKLFDCNDNIVHLAIKHLPFVNKKFMKNKKGRNYFFRL